MQLGVALFILFGSRQCMFFLALQKKIGFGLPSSSGYAGDQVLSRVSSSSSIVCVKVHGFISLKLFRDVA